MIKLPQDGHGEDETLDDVMNEFAAGLPQLPDAVAQMGKLPEREQLRIFKESVDMTYHDLQKFGMPVTYEAIVQQQLSLFRTYGLDLSTLVNNANLSPQ